MNDTGNMRIVTNPVEAQRIARGLFERMWAVDAGWDLPKRVGDAWWPLTLDEDET